MVNGQRPDTCRDAAFDLRLTNQVAAGTHQVQHRVAAARARGNQAPLNGTGNGQGSEELTEISGEGFDVGVPSGDEDSPLEGGIGVMDTGTLSDGLGSGVAVDDGVGKTGVGVGDGVVGRTVGTGGVATT